MSLVVVGVIVVIVAIVVIIGVTFLLLLVVCFRRPQCLSRVHRLISQRGLELRNFLSSAMLCGCDLLCDFQRHLSIYPHIYLFTYFAHPT